MSSVFSFFSLDFFVFMFFAVSIFSGGGVGLHIKDMEHSKTFYHDWLQKMPPQWIAHSNVLKHTLADSSKVVYLDPTLMLEGFTGKFYSKEYLKNNL